jgi:hypothetical protein
VTEKEEKCKSVEKVQPVEIVPKKRSYMCRFEDCGKTFQYQSIFKEHLLVHGEKQVEL